VVDPSSVETEPPEETGLGARLRAMMSDLLTSPKTRKRRQQASFHMRVAQGLKPAAMSGSPDDWHAYYDELGRAILADEEHFTAYWLRCHAPIHFFESLRPDRRAAKTREIARRWDADLRWLLTHFPDDAPAGTSLAEARELRVQFERLCRGVERG